MTTTKCETCNGTEYVCSTCGFPRSHGPSRFGSGRHANCQRRPKGVKKCPTHVATITRCDYCGTPAAGGHPNGWKSERRGQMCLECQERLEVAIDAIVGGLDFASIGDHAVENLIAALNRVKPGDIKSSDMLLRLHDAAANFEDRWLKLQLERQRATAVAGITPGVELRIR